MDLLISSLWEYIECGNVYNTPEEKLEVYNDDMEHLIKLIETKPECVAKRLREFQADGIEGAEEKLNGCAL